MDSSSHSEDLRSIHLVASELGVGVNTLKRFLDSNPELLKMVRKTKGGHWRVEATRENLGKLRDSLIIWKFWSRKGVVRPIVRTQKEGSGGPELIRNRPKCESARMNFLAFVSRRSCGLKKDSF